MPLVQMKELRSLLDEGIDLATEYREVLSGVVEVFEARQQRGDGRITFSDPELPEHHLFGGHMPQIRWEGPIAGFVFNIAAVVAAYNSQDRHPADMVVCEVVMGQACALDALLSGPMTLERVLYSACERRAGLGVEWVLQEHPLMFKMEDAAAADGKGRGPLVEVSAHDLALHLKAEADADVGKKPIAEVYVYCALPRSLEDA